jgi:hypothetical protein
MPLQRLRRAMLVVAALMGALVEGVVEVVAAALARPLPRRFPTTTGLLGFRQPTTQWRAVAILRVPWLMYEYMRVLGPAGW